jgi:hypothetical protein
MLRHVKTEVDFRNSRLRGPRIKDAATQQSDLADMLTRTATARNKASSS